MKESKTTQIKPILLRLFEYLHCKFYTDWVRKFYVFHVQLKMFCWWMLIRFLNLYQIKESFHHHQDSIRPSLRSCLNDVLMNRASCDCRSILCVVIKERNILYLWGKNVRVYPYGFTEQIKDVIYCLHICSFQTLKYKYKLNVLIPYAWVLPIIVL